MTMTKIAYLIAAIAPGGLILLACLGIAHVAMTGLKDRRARLALQRVPVKAGR
ncbi:hypothetical protein RLW55_19265 [Hyphomicrobium sp. B1]|jgi:hypothetical protein|uniref:hypothetical protein n=1 Tax=unclassified Hyphomicrobium TaxID=2619925 RepID=UPI00391B247D